MHRIYTQKGLCFLLQITARVRSTTEVMFSQVCVCSGGGGGVYPISIPQNFNWSHAPSEGTPVTGPRSQDGITPPLATTGWGTTPWTGYAAGGTPLAVSHRTTFLFNNKISKA